MELTIKFKLPEPLLSFAEVTYNSEAIANLGETIETNTTVKLAIHESELLVGEIIRSTFEDMITTISNAMMCKDSFAVIEAEEIIEPTFTKAVSMEDLRALHDFVHTYVI